jgi:hypothetical protein
MSVTRTAEMKIIAIFSKRGAHIGAVKCKLLHLDGWRSRAQNCPTRLLPEFFWPSSCPGIIELS